MKSKTETVLVGREFTIPGSLGHFSVPNVPIELVLSVDSNKFKSDEEYDLYISGAMSGKHDHGQAQFNNMAKLFRRLGLRVFNPAENFGGRTDLSRSTYMRKDHAALTRCGGILMLEGWRSSEGAVAEMCTALSIPNLDIYFVSECLDDRDNTTLIFKMLPIYESE